MTKRVRLKLALLTTMPIVACDNTADFDAIRTLPKDTQKVAFAQCARERGLSQWLRLRLNKIKSRDGLLYFAGSDGSGFTVGEAHGVNLCAWAKLEALANAN